MTRASKRTLALLGDELAQGWPVRRVEVLFDDADISLGPPEAAGDETSVRRALAKRYVASLDLDDAGDAAKLQRVLGTVLADVHLGLPDSQVSYDRWVAYLRRDGFTVDEAAGSITSVSVRLTEAALSALPDASAIHDHLRRLGDNVDTDPRAAVSTAKALVESTAKLVLRQRGIAYTTSDSIPQLVARAQESLKLSAKGATASTPEEEKALKTILQSLVTLAQGVTELRNKVGVDHGRESVPTWVRPRHARLASGAAQVWCQLMLETLDDATAPWRKP